MLIYVLIVYVICNSTYRLYLQMNRLVKAPHYNNVIWVHYLVYIYAIYFNLIYIRNVLMYIVYCFSSLY